jgi:hypothetical protein
LFDIEKSIQYHPNISSSESDPASLLEGWIIPEQARSSGPPAEENQRVWVLCFAVLIAEITIFYAPGMVITRVTTGVNKGG